MTMTHSNPNLTPLVTLTSKTCFVKELEILEYWSDNKNRKVFFEKGINNKEKVRVKLGQSRK